MKVDIDKKNQEKEILIDTSKMSKGQRDALELTESARDEVKEKDSFIGQLFMGKADFESIFPFPEPEPEKLAEGLPFLNKLKTFLEEHVDADEIDRTGEIPENVIKMLAEMGAFAIKVPKKYGGLGLCQTIYSRAAMLLGTHCGNLTALLSAHQSIGVPQPLLLFGTEEQKAKFLPRFSRGDISAFALTEAGVGSDPSKMETHAEPTEDGKHFLLNGEKLWCTNGTKAGVIIVMASTPPKRIKGKERKQVTAFIVETNSPGLEVKQRCYFMGLKALYNGVMSFKNVKIPIENIVLGEGKGLKVALSTLNTGRLTLPAACTGMTRECIRINKKWSNERRQWGNNIGKHAAIAEKISKMTAQLFAMESMVLLSSALVDRKEGDIRLEAAMCKMWGTEKAWSVVDETMQIRGGRGYETADSQKSRGEDPIPVERFMRDCRINTIFEGSSEIMRLFLAREALDPHLSIAGAALNSKLPPATRIQSVVKSALFYSIWYPKMWMPSTDRIPEVHKRLYAPLKYVSKTSRKLARTLFHAMVLNGPKLEKKQPLLARYVEIGTELFVITASVLRADSLIKRDREGSNHQELIDLVYYITKESKIEIGKRFEALNNNNDSESYKIAQGVLNGEYDSLLKRI